MYETLCSLGALLFQGVAAGLIVAGFTRWFENKDSRARHEAAAMFIKLEVSEHRIILSELVSSNKMIIPDSPPAFSTSYWLDFRADLVGLIPVGELKQITDYYNSIYRILALSSGYSYYKKRKELIASTYAESKVIFDLLSYALDNQNSHSMFGEVFHQCCNLFWDRQNHT